MRITVAGAGVAGLTAAVALQRDGHDVKVVEAAPELRASGFGLNLWSNATTLLDRLGVAIPGEPFDVMDVRAGGRVRASMLMPAIGSPHVNAERGEVLEALAATLRPGTIEYGVTAESVAALRADGAELVIAADGFRSKLRPGARTAQRASKPWVVWQSVIADWPDVLPAGHGAAVMGPRSFVGIFRGPHDSVVWFVEAPDLDRVGTAEDVLAHLAVASDGLVRELARRTPPEQLVRWEARDRWPDRRIIGDAFAVIGDAAHPMLPCIGQGACTAIEDAVVLADALRDSNLASGLAHYRSRRLRTTRSRVALAHVACLLRKPSPIASAVGSTRLVIPFAVVAGALLRAHSRPVDS